MSCNDCGMSGMGPDGCSHPRCFYKKGAKAPKREPSPPPNPDDVEFDMCTAVLVVSIILGVMALVLISKLW